MVESENESDGQLQETLRRALATKAVALRVYGEHKADLVLLSDSGRGARAALGTAEEIPGRATQQEVALLGQLMSYLSHGVEESPRPVLGPHADASNRHVLDLRDREAVQMAIDLLGGREAPGVFLGPKEQTGAPAVQYLNQRQQQLRVLQ